MKLSAPLFRLKRQARSLAREESLPLHAALDRIASREGYSSWGHLSSVHTDMKPEARVLDELENGEMVLLAARPGHGKTILGIRLLAEASRSGFRTAFFSSECSQDDVRRRLPGQGRREVDRFGMMQIDLSDHLCADHIEAGLSEAGSGTVVVIDYLQVLDQRRTTPALGTQVEQLKRFALEKDLKLVFLSQIHWSFDPDEKRLPDFSDLRLPNPVNLSLFSKGCFLHDGEMAVLVN